MYRAYATLELKSFDDAERVLEGIASTPTTDRKGDIIEPLGAQFTLPLPLLWQHDTHQPIGHVIEATPLPTGIRIRARLAKVDEPGALKDRLDEVYQTLRAGLVRGLSIGIRPIEAKPIAGSFGLHVLKWLWAELSAVTLPANVEATILSIKAAADGPHSPVLTGRSTTARMTPMTIPEQITGFENTRAAQAARMNAIMAKAAEDNATLDQTQTEEYDDLARKVETVDAHLVRLRALEKHNTAAAVAVPPVTTTKAASDLRGGMPVVQVKSQLPVGTAFVRAACATLVCKGNFHEAAQYAHARWHDTTPEVELYLKAAVAAGNTTDAAWAGPLVNQGIAKDFLELLMPATILGRIPGLRTVPFNTKVPSQTAGGTYGWVGEAKPKPVTHLAFSSETLAIAKAAGIIILTEELVRLSSPSAEDLARRDMIRGIAKFLDSQFIDPAVAAVAGVNPASITNGAPTAAATTDPLADLMSLISFFATNNVPVEGLTIILSPVNALSLSFRMNADGSPQFPGVTINGGNYKGINFVTSQTAAGLVIAVQPDLILYADDGGVTIDASREASVQMDSAPTSPADATTVLVSLWQHNLVGLRAERFVNWKRASAYAVKYLTAAAYPAPTGVGASARSQTSSEASKVPPPTK